ncbi:MAG: hypothetical protein AB7U73_18685 [Pirellulales bacterium]
MRSTDVEENAYRPDDPVANEGDPAAGSPREMSVLKAIATVAGCAFLFAVAGAAIGGALGVLAPGYYRAVFSSGDAPWFDPPVVGLGLGLSQGAVLGVFAGLVLVAIFVWRQTKRGSTR